jgi:hypothetical protein
LRLFGQILHPQWLAQTSKMGQKMDFVLQGLRSNIPCDKGEIDMAKKKQDPVLNNVSWNSMNDSMELIVGTLYTLLTPNGQRELKWLFALLGKLPYVHEVVGAFETS